MTLNGFPTVLRHETVWLDAHRYSEAETQYHEYCARRNTAPTKANVCQSFQDHKGKPVSSSLVSDIANTQEKVKNMLPGQPETSSLISDIANARKKIKKILSGDVEQVVINSSILQRLQRLSDENNEMKKTMTEMSSKIKLLEDILSELNISKGDAKGSKQTCKSSEANKQNGLSEKAANGDEDDLDLFGSDEETEEDARLKEERLKAYENKKSKKPALIAKSSVVLDVKPWDDETDMKALEEAVRSVECDGLKWGAGKLVPLAYGIKKLQLVAIVEDDKVSIDWLQEAIQEHEDLVQSVDIAAFNKL